MSLDLDGLDTPPPQASGTPLLLPVDSIDEDPLQPRSEFDQEPLQQLAASIAQRGVLQAISVRRHPHKPERWMLNFGARRVRASKLAGQTQIPAYVNEAATSYDQVIENEQREGLKPLELALFVQSRLALGESRSDIARQLGKSQPYITYAMAMIDAPDWLIGVYRAGQCRGMAELYHLRRLHAQDPDHVQAWIDQQPAISRSDIQRLKLELRDGGQASNEAGSIEPVVAVEAGPPVMSRTVALAQGSAIKAPAAARSAATTVVDAAPALAGRVSATVASRRRSSANRLFGELGGQAVEIVLDAVPSMAGRVFVRTRDASEASEVAARDVVLIGFQASSAT
jgi:ParB family transcriptional regulator, chromosome partitioning protein